MAKKDIPEEKPKVSKLPLPISDSPLVIDLPDGQKIVVGKMTSGSVIEVATWRGVGRPDSRTSRLMLGMGSGNVEEPSDSTTAPTAVKKSVKPQGAAVVIYYLQLAISPISKLPWGKALTIFKRIKFIKPAPKKLAAGVATPAALESSAPVAVPTISKASTASTDLAEPDIEEWLNRISARASKTVADREKRASGAPKKATTVKKAAKKPSSAKSSRK